MEELSPHTSNCLQEDPRSDVNNMNLLIEDTIFTEDDVESVKSIAGQKENNDVNHRISEEETKDIKPLFLDVKLSLAQPSLNDKEAMLIHDQNTHTEEQQIQISNVISLSQVDPMSNPSPVVEETANSSPSLHSSNIDNAFPYVKDSHSMHPGKFII